MTKTIRLLLLASVFAGCQASSAQEQVMTAQGDIDAVAATQGLPNIVILLADDMGYHDLSLTGSDIFQTPAIDALAGESVQFTKAYSSYPRCVPSRYGLMTASYPIKENKGNLAAIPEQSNPVKQLDALGYNSFFVGKWHLGVGGSLPVGYGFDGSFAAGATGGAETRHYPFNIKRKAGGTGEKTAMPDVEAYGSDGDYLSDLLTKRGLEFVDEAAGEDNPFLLVMSYYSVHTPLEAKDADRERNQREIDAYDFGDTPEFVSEGFGRRKMRQDEADYAGMVENLDENVAMVLEDLERRGLADNTIVVFTSDHGGLSNDGNARQRQLATTNEPLRAGKGHLYEGGIRVPLFVRWPAALAPSVEGDAPVLGMDIFPSLLDMVADVSLSGVDGESFEPVVTGQTDWSDRAVFWHSTKARPYSTGDSPATAMRQGDWKLMDFWDEGRTELYNLASDPSETTDLSDSEPQQLAQMMAAVEAWRASENAKTKARINKKKMVGGTKKNADKKLSPEREARRAAKREARRAARKAEKARKAED